MRFIFLVLMLVSYGFSQYQIVHRGVDELFPFTDNDSTKMNQITANIARLPGVLPDTYLSDRNEYFVLTDSSSTARTFYSKLLDSNDALGGLFITARADSIAGTMSTNLEIGLYRGWGYAGNDGFEWKFLNTLSGTADSCAIVLSDSAWWIDQHTTYYRYRFTETGAGAQNLILHEFRFEEDE